MRRLMWLIFFVGIGGVGWFVWRKVTEPVSHGPIADAPPHANPQRMTRVATSASPESTNDEAGVPGDHGHETVAKKSPAKKTAAKKPAAKKTAAKKAPAKKSPTKKVTADQSETSSTESASEQPPEA